MVGGGRGEETRTATVKMQTTSSASGGPPPRAPAKKRMLCGPFTGQQFGLAVLAMLVGVWASRFVTSAVVERLRVGTGSVSKSPLMQTQSSSSASPLSSSRSASVSARRETSSSASKASSPPPSLSRPAVFVAATNPSHVQYGCSTTLPPSSPSEKLWQSNFLYEPASPSSFSPHPGAGLHYLCLNVHNASHASLQLYKDASALVSHVFLDIRAGVFERELLAAVKDAGVDNDHLLEGVGRDSSGSKYPTQPFSLFDQIGNRLVSKPELAYLSSSSLPSSPAASSTFETLSSSQLVLLFSGGSFMWPGVKVGHVRPHPSLPLSLQTLSLQPLLFSLVGKFLSDSECDYIQNKATPHMRSSDVSRMDKDVGKPASLWRTSQQHFLPSHRDDVLQVLNERVAQLVATPVEHQEDVQVLRYGVTEKYDGHHDYFDPSLYAKDERTQNLIDRGRRNRLSTVFWYLSDVGEGGHTIFLRAGGRPQPRRFDDCSDEAGLKVAPKKGTAIIFYSLTFGGWLDPYSLHGGCPVQEGLKWSANKWVWNSPMNYTQPRAKSR